MDKLSRYDGTPRTPFEKLSETAQKALRRVARTRKPKALELPSEVASEMQEGWSPESFVMVPYKRGTRQVAFNLTTRRAWWF